MSIHESSTPTPLREAPGAFPDQPDDGDGAQGASNLNTLSRAVHARRAEYIRQRTVKVRIGSWNVAALPGTEEDLGRWFAGPLERTDKSVGEDAPQNVELGHADGASLANDENRSNERCAGKPPSLQGPSRNATVNDRAAQPADEDMDIFVLGLQEIVDLSSPAETLRPYVDPAPANKWKEAIHKALPSGYTLISSQQLTGLLLLVYASQSIAPSISSVSSTSVGTGLMGYMGNKGAVATRIVLGGATRIVLINCHLSAGADKASLDRRNWDASQIVMRTKFDPIEGDDDVDFTSSQTLGDEEFAFWFGDLNYRLEDIPGEDVRRLLHLHTENDFGPLPKRDTDSAKSRCSQEFSRSEGNFSSEAISMADNDVETCQDPASLETTLASLLPHDQLRAQQKNRKAFYEAWREGDIKFLPTYKYDIGRIGQFDSGEKQRSPSWCDRILYRTKEDYLKYQRRMKEDEDARKRDEEMKYLGLDQEAEDDNVLFDYDPEFDGAEYDENEDTVEDIVADTDQGNGSGGSLNMTCYRSHQDIVSSDHKPIHADFILTYDAVIQDLKAKVHQEVARELDKAENEARPDITVVVDQPANISEDHKLAPNGIADRDTVSFGQVRYDVPISRSVTLANTGSVPATLSFQYRPVAADEDSRVSPPWLHLKVDWPADAHAQTSSSQKEYTLPPGESAHVQLVLCVFDVNFVRQLNTGEAELEDILVLRVSSGRDHFISVRGKWLLSCFGLSLEELTRIPEGGIRSLDVASLSPYLSGNNQIDNIRTSAPRELFRLTEAVAELTERSIAEWGMIGNGDDTENNARPWGCQRAGWPFEPETWSLRNSRERYKLLGLIREGLDTGAPFFAQFPAEVPSRYRAELLAETLLAFLRSLYDGLITRALWSEVESQVFSYEKSMSASLSPEQSQSQVLEALASSPAHSVSFTFLTFMLNRISSEIAPLVPPPISTPVSPITPTTPSISSLDRRSTDLTEPLSPSISMAAPILPRPSITFSFPFRSRSRTLSSSDDNNVPVSHSRPPTSSATINIATSSIARRQAVNKAFVAIFADVIYSKDIPVPEKDKERRVLAERKRSVIEPFLRSEADS
ncbi:phosphatase [Coccidioides immitis RS]|uniref:Phosphatase n=2 Tax=Coccidioides immitis TaxID=5501 RepID=J3K7J6_COCIM|nr:phosphatase [Coccidioides immitis RS]EAS30678.3 phosphatase [Coccidioides immitis RS]KMP03242.1 phosphatase family protein [Coccidioides immitis RMSCC 2394]